MAIKVSEETKKRTNQLPYEANISDFTEVHLSNFEVIAPQEGRALPVSVWFVHQGVLYEFLNPASYTIKNFNAVLGLRKRHVGFKLFVKSAENIQFLRFVEECRVEVIPKKQSEKIVREVIDDVRDKAEDILGSISNMNIDPSLAATSRQVVSEVVTAVMSQPKLVTLFSKLLEMDGSYLDHAVATSMISAAIGKHIGLRAKELGIISLGALLHDIGLFKLPSRIIGPNKELSGDELELYKTHTSYGQELLDKMMHSGIRIPPEAEVIVLQHHERFNGLGYPNRKRGKQETEGNAGIHLYARIVAIADTYVEYLEEVKISPEITQAQILARMFKQDGSFDPTLLRKFKEIIKEEMT